MEKNQMIVNSLEQRAERINKAGRQKAHADWKKIHYTVSEFRDITTKLNSERNLSRFVYRTARFLQMREITISDVNKMLEEADETLWILMGEMKFDADGGRAGTWVKTIERKGIWSSMMRIEKSGLATSTLRPVKVAGKTFEQRVWTLTK